MAASDRSAWFDLPVWFAESHAILAARVALGDEQATEIGQKVLSEDRQLALAQRHQQQFSTMVEAASGDDG